MLHGVAPLECREFAIHRLQIAVLNGETARTFLPVNPRSKSGEHIDILPRIPL